MYFTDRITAMAASAGEASVDESRAAMEGGEAKGRNYFRQRWIYKKLMVRRTMTPVFFSKAALLRTINLPRAPADERKMHFTCARGGSPGARGRAHDPAERSCAQLVNLVL